MPAITRTYIDRVVMTDCVFSPDLASIPLRTGARPTACRENPYPGRDHRPICRRPAEPETARRQRHTEVEP